MKKTSLAALIAVSSIAISYNALAQNTAQGGFSGPSVEVVTVEQAKAMGDDAYVVLQGNITQNIGDEKYTFQDASGTIEVEIDNEDWNGLNVVPEDMVEIRGEVDKGWTTIEIDVDQINKITK